MLNYAEQQWLEYSSLVVRWMDTNWIHSTVTNSPTPTLISKLITAKVEHIYPFLDWINDSPMEMNDFINIIILVWS